MPLRQLIFLHQLNKRFRVRGLGTFLLIKRRSLGFRKTQTFVGTSCPKAETVFSKVIVKFYWKASRALPRNPGFTGKMRLTTVLSGCGFCRWNSVLSILTALPLLFSSACQGCCCAKTSDFLRNLLFLQLLRKRKALCFSRSYSCPLSTLSACLPGLFKRCKWDVSGRLDAGPCCSKRINFDSFPFFLKLRILSIIALSLSESLCLERFCSAQWLTSKLKLETNWKCFSAAEPVCSPGIITLITGCPGSGIRTGGKITANIHARSLVCKRTGGCCWVRTLIIFALIPSPLVLLSPKFVSQINQFHLNLGLW